jgi:hypothetical protein
MIKKIIYILLILSLYSCESSESQIKEKEERNERIFCNRLNNETEYFLYGYHMLPGGYSITGRQWLIDIGLHKELQDFDLIYYNPEISCHEKLNRYIELYNIFLELKEKAISEGRTINHPPPPVYNSGRVQSKW